jgi:hypothetical protein
MGVVVMSMMCDEVSQHVFVFIAIAWDKVYGWHHMEGTASDGGCFEMDLQVYA